MRARSHNLSSPSSTAVTTTPPLPRTRPAATSSDAGAPPQKMIIFCPYFGPRPTWIHALLASMAANGHVRFVFLSDFNLGIEELPKNVLDVPTSMQGIAKRMKTNLIKDSAKLTNETVFKWATANACHGIACGHSRNNKLTDIRPLLGILFREYTLQHEWWGYMDIDLLFGRLPLSPPHNADVICSLYPNQFGFTTWGAFTAYRVNATLRALHTNRSAPGIEPFKLSGMWENMLLSPKQWLFDEYSRKCGGSRCEGGMVNVLHPSHCQKGRWTRIREVHACLSANTCSNSLKAERLSADPRNGTLSLEPPLWVSGKKNLLAAFQREIGIVHFLKAKRYVSDMFNETTSEYLGSATGGFQVYVSIPYMRSTDKRANSVR